MLVELVDVETSDGVKLNGALQRPVEQTPSACGLDAVICVHGSWSNFYGSFITGVGRRFVPWGAAALYVNTRGHDGVCNARGANGMVVLGGAYEIVGDCRHDVAAWVDFLRARGYSRIGVLGHSLGAVKAVYALAHSHQADVKALVAISPPRLSHAKFRETERGAEFAKDCETASELVRQGRERSLMEVRLPLPQVITAAAYLDKYGPDERYNILRYLDRLTTPSLFVYGGLELGQNAAFGGMDEEIESRRAALPNLSSAVIAGGDHVYTGVLDALAARIELWLRRNVAKA